MKRDELIALDKRHVWHPYTPMRQYIESGEPLVVARARGCIIEDVDGRRYLDGNASWWTSLLGHNHPRLLEALRHQAEAFCHVAFAGITHEPAVLLAEKLAQRAPGLMPRVFFSDNGSTAVEAALKMSLQFHAQNGSPERTMLVALEHAFHGETLGVTALGGVAAFRKAFHKSLPIQVLHVPSPGAPDAQAEPIALARLERTLEEHGSRIAAVVLEPLIQGAGGMLMHGAAYLRAAHAWTRAHQVHLIVDEVFTGFGRTGTFWACDQAGVEPDILCTAKGLSGGVLPFAATLTSPALFEGFLGASDRAFYYGHTFAGHPLGARVALEVLAIYEEEKVLEGVPERARRLAAAFEKLAELPGIHRARSLGMCAAIDLGDGADYLNPLGWRVFEEAKRRGAYLRPLGNVVYVAPALNIPLPDLDELLQIVHLSVEAVMKDYGKA